MRQANREAIAEMAVTIRVIAENGRYDPMQIAGLADSIQTFALEDAFGSLAIAGDHDHLAIARGIDTHPTDATKSPVVNRIMERMCCANKYPKE